MPDEAEADLVARCLRADERAWDSVWEIHYPAVTRFLFQLGPSLTPEDVEEIAQDTFLAVVRNLRSFRGGSRLQTWIFQIAANKFRDFVEKRQAAKRGGGTVTASLQAEDPRSGLTIDPPDERAPEPDAALIAREKGMQIRAALDALGEPCREIVELRYFADVSYEELAVTLDLNVKTVSSRLSKCLDRLGVKFEEITSAQREKFRSYSV